MKLKITRILKKIHSSTQKLKRVISGSGQNTYLKTFTNIYNKNLWGSNESISGPGSDLVQTKEIIKEYPNILRDFKIKSLLDIPCGDFNWMQKVELDGIQYVGGDIVKEVILLNNQKYGADNVKFEYLDILKNELPNVDLITCRDLLVHFSYDDIFKAIENIKNSNSKYLLTTSFTQHSNQDILTGDWRPLNLEVEPFNFSKSILTINEKCTENDGIYNDKSLMLFEIKDL